MVRLSLMVIDYKNEGGGRYRDVYDVVALPDTIFSLQL